MAKKQITAVKQTEIENNAAVKSSRISQTRLITDIDPDYPKDRNRIINNKTIPLEEAQSRIDTLKNYTRKGSNN